MDGDPSLLDLVLEDLREAFLGSGSATVSSCRSALMSMHPLVRPFFVQQILGSCSPASMVTTRSPPTRDRSITMPGCSATTSPTIAAFLPNG